MPAPWHGGGGEEAGRGAGNPLRPAPLSGIPVGQDDQVVPTDYFNGLVASAAGRLPQPLSAADLADLWDSLWFLLMATADGKPSENFSLLENEWDRQDQLRWFPTPTTGASEVEALAPGQNKGNGAHDPASAGTPYAREMGGTAPCPLRPVCGAHRIHAGLHSDSMAGTTCPLSP